jgi:CrcB protein
MREVGAVFLGGLLGTGIRWSLDTALPHGDDGFPLSTLLINVVGAFVLGLLVARVWPSAPPWLRAGLGTGVLGSFTTFSAFAVALVTLTDAAAPATAVGYLLLTLVVGIGAAFAGLSLGARLRVAPADSGTE